MLPLVPRLARAPMLPVMPWRLARWLVCWPFAGPFANGSLVPRLPRTHPLVARLACFRVLPLVPWLASLLVRSLARPLALPLARC